MKNKSSVKTGAFINIPSILPKMWYNMSDQIKGGEVYAAIKANIGFAFNNGVNNLLHIGRPGR
jgi:hypothetical protein